MLPKYQLVKESIKKRIAGGQWRPGARIASERVLADELGVSRITVKKAVSDLINEGTLVHPAGRRGTFVRERSPRSASTRLIGVAIDDVSDFFGSDLLRGIEDYLWDRRFHTLICNGDRDFSKVEEYFNSLIEHSIAGLVFSPVIDSGYVRNNTRLIAFLQRNGIPFVLVDRFVPGTLCNYVGVNHRESSRQIVSHLVERGHRRIAVCVGLECTSMDERLEGYRDALRAAGIRADRKLVIRSNDNLLHRRPDSGELGRMKEQMRASGGFTCFYALNSRLLYSGIRVLVDLGTALGTEVFLASHDEIRKPMPPYTDDLPHVIQPCYEMGWESARILLQHIGEPDAPIVQMTLRARFVESGVRGQP